MDTYSTRFDPYLPGQGGPGGVTAQSLDAAIAHEESVNGRRSPLEGMGAYLVALGQQYGIDPAVVLGTMEKENSLGTVDDAIVPYNNFGGNTCGAVGITTASGCVNVAGRSWDTFPSVQAGVTGVFQTLNSPLYRNTGGTLQDVMTIYSPPDENPNFWPTYAEVGQEVGEPLGPNTPVYTGIGTGIGAAAAGTAYGATNASLQQVLQQYGSGMKRAGVGLAAIAVIVLGAIAL